MATQKDIKFSKVNKVSIRETIPTVYSDLARLAKSEFVHPILLEDIDLNKVIWENTYIIGSGNVNVPVGFFSGKMIIRKQVGVKSTTKTDSIRGATYQKLVSDDFNGPTYNRFANDSKHWSAWLKQDNDKDAAELLKQEAIRFSEGIVKLTAEFETLQSKTQEDVATFNTRIDESRVIAEKSISDNSEISKMFDVEATLREEAIQNLKVIIYDERASRITTDEQINTLIATISDDQSEKFAEFADKSEAVIKAIDTQVSEGIEFITKQKFSIDDKLNEFQNGLFQLQTMFKSLSTLMGDVSEEDFLDKIGTELNYVNIDDDYQMAENDYIQCDTSNGSMYLVLPKNPRVNSVIYVLDVGGKFDFKPAKIDHNGHSVMGIVGDTVLNKKNYEYKLRYTGKEFRII